MANEEPAKRFDPEAVRAFLGVIYPAAAIGGSSVWAKYTAYILTGTGAVLGLCIANAAALDRFISPGCIAVAGLFLVCALMLGIVERAIAAFIAATAETLRFLREQHAGVLPAFPSSADAAEARRRMLDARIGMFRLLRGAKGDDVGVLKRVFQWSQVQAHIGLVIGMCSAMSGVVLATGLLKLNAYAGLGIGAGCIAIVVLIVEGIFSDAR